VVGSSYTLHNYPNEQVYPFEDMHHHSQWCTEGGGLGGSTPPPEIPKISVESSITWARRTGISISNCSSLCSRMVV